MKSFAAKLGQIFESVLKAVVGAVLGLFGKGLDERQWALFMQFVKFCLVGVSNTAVSLVTYYIFVLIDPQLYLVGSVAGFFLSVLNSYFWNSRFVFKKENERVKTLAKTFLAYGTNLVIGTALLYLFVDILGVSEFIAPLINLIATIPINFVLNKFWVMK